MNFKAVLTENYEAVKLIVGGYPPHPPPGSVPDPPLVSACGVDKKLSKMVGNVAMDCGEGSLIYLK